MIETAPDDVEEAKVCALDGCDNPLPPPAVDAEGRRKGGRPSAYCGKAHADAASRARRTAAVSSVADPLVEVRRIAGEFEPAAAALVESLEGIRAGFAQAESAALGRVTEAEAEAAVARREAEDAAQAVAKAETVKATALASSRDDRLAKAKAEKTAEQALKDADESRQRAWAEVAAHERARGAAEAAAMTAERSRDELATELRVLREDFLAVREDKSSLAAQLGERDTALARAVAELESLLDRLDEAKSRLSVSEKDREAARAETGALRGELGVLRDELDRVRAETGREHTARRLAEERAAGLAEELAQARQRSAADQGRYEKMVAQLAELARPVAPESPDDGAATVGG